MGSGVRSDATTRKERGMSDHDEQEEMTFFIKAEPNGQYS